LLLWIAVKLEKGEEDEEHAVGESGTLWKAVRTIAIADAVMSLDNVVAIAAASKGHPELFVFGLMLSIPLIVVGASVITALIKRLPLLVWAGAALLGWIAGEMIVTDPLIAARLEGSADTAHLLAAACGALLVVILGYALSQSRKTLTETE
jgi:YjbE family integral membrane protein